MKSIDVDHLSDGELHTVVIELTRQIDELSAVQSQLIAAWNNRNVWSNNGSRSPGHRLSSETGISISSGKRIAHRAKRLTSMKVTREAFLSGELSCDRVDLLVQANQPKVRHLFLRDEKLLVDQVKEILLFSEAKKALDYWSQYADETSSESKAEYLFARRSCSVTKTFEGSVDIRSLLDPISGEIFSEELRRIEQELFEQDWQEAKNLVGEEELRSNWELYSSRTPKQRRADALIEMAKRSAGFGSKNKKPRPLITVVVGYETLKGKLCELSSGTVITPGQIIPLLDEADIERIVFDGPSRVIDVSEKRSFKGALRRAIQVRDVRCQHESGCDEPADNCDVDHIQPFNSGGKTSQENGQPLCSPHNRWKGDDVSDIANDDEEDDSG